MALSDYEKMRDFSKSQEPEGTYGAGCVRIWDSGEFGIEKDEENELLFELKGKRLRGKYALIRTKFRGKESWLFFKRK